MFIVLALASVLVFSFDADGSCAANEGISKWYYGGWSSRGCGIGCQQEACRKQGMEIAHQGTTTQRGIVYVCCVDTKNGPCRLESRCRSLATAMGLKLGGAGYSFAGNYGTEGCYYYPKSGGGSYAGIAYFGKPDVYESARKELYSSDQKRIPGWDCTPTAEESVASMGSLERPKAAAMARLEAAVGEGMVDAYAVKRIKWEYAQKGCLPKPYKSHGEGYTTYNCAKKCRNDPGCKQFSMKGSKCWTTSNDYIVKCEGWFATDEDVYRILAADEEAIYMQQTHTSTGQYAVNGFALLGFAAVFYGAARFYIK